MGILVDTSVLGRLANRTDILHAAAQAAVMRLHRRGEILHVTAQNLVEFRSFATRPIAVNGLGMTAAQASAVAAAFEATFPMLDETPAVYPAWRSLVERIGVVGKQVHDARLVAVCQVHGVKGVLTFNVAHFARLASPETGIEVLDPLDVARSAPP